VEPHARLAENLRELRLGQQLTQREVAEAAGIRSTVIARYERGEVRDPLLSTLARLARGLDVPLSQLLRGIE
jgi:transcriptional regulator with XRE-family HTH domain